MSVQFTVHVPLNLKQSVKLEKYSQKNDGLKYPHQIKMKDYYFKTAMNFKRFARTVFVHLNHAKIGQVWQWHQSER